MVENFVKIIFIVSQTSMRLSSPKKSFRTTPLKTLNSDGVRLPQTQTGIYLNTGLIQGLTTKAKNLSLSPSCPNIRGPTLTISMHDHIR